jgi:hypothetical protein
MRQGASRKFMKRQNVLYQLIHFKLIDATKGERNNETETSMDTLGESDDDLRMQE